MGCCAIKLPFALSLSEAGEMAGDNRGCKQAQEWDKFRLQPCRYHFLACHSGSISGADDGDGGT